MPDTAHKGSCLCGAVKIRVEGKLSDADGCHCSQCRKQTGHYLVSTNVPKSALSVEGEENVRWYPSSDNARRGFCGTCGSTLFWDPLRKDGIAIAMGLFDGPTGAKLTHHIFTADKGDYYEITDGLPQNSQ
ncbi:GFA family protein [Parasphingorhabdus sp.]|uniref:GFA family protein n=1 Tax=Parasphingorhabdus sp. TaxID=2709688 RepID=UPI002F91E08C